MSHTPGPWKIDWYDCVMDKDDVTHAHKEGNTSAKVGDVMWRAPRSIGPLSIEHSHWGGDLLTVEEDDARLIAAAPDLLEALRRAVEALDALTDMVDGTGFSDADEFNRALDEIHLGRAAIAKAQGER